MHYTLHQKTFTDEIINADISTMVLVYSKSFVRIYDMELNIVAERKYNTKVYQAAWFNDQIVVLMEVCRMEVLEIKRVHHPVLKTHIPYGFNVVCLRYYEQPYIHAHKINNITPHDIYDNQCYITPHAIFKSYKHLMLLRISVTHMALITHDSTVLNLIGTGLEGFTSYCFMPDFPLPTALFVCDTIKLFTIKTMMKIDEFKMDNVINAMTLRSGICLQTHESLFISHSKNYKNFYEVNIKGHISVFNDDIYVCNESIYRVGVVFMHGRVKDCLIEKIHDNGKYSWITFGRNMCILGNEEDDCDIFEINYKNIQENERENMSIMVDNMKLEQEITKYEGCNQNDESIYKEIPNIKHIEGHGKLDNEIQNSEIINVQNEDNRKPSLTHKDDPYLELNTTDDIYGDEKTNNIDKSLRLIDNVFLENLYENTKSSNFKSTIELKHKFTIVNYSIRSMHHHLNQLVCVGRNKLVILSDIVEMNLQFVMKICGFIRFYKIGKLFCFTNQRESYFVTSNGVEVDTFITDKETLEFVALDSKYIQITKDGMNLFENETHVMFPNITDIKCVKKSQNILYVLDFNECLWVIKDLSIIRKYHNVHLFAVERELWIISHNRLIGFNDTCVFECILNYSDVILNIIDPETLIIKDEDVYISQLQSNFECLITEFEIYKNVFFFLGSGNITAYRYDINCLKSYEICLPPVTLGGFIRLKDKLFIRPDIIISFSDGLSIQRASHRIVHITDKYLLTRNTLSKYKFGPSFKLKYKIPDFNGEFININDVIVVGGFIKDDFYQHFIRLISSDILKPENTNRSVKDFILDEYKYVENEFITDLKFLKLNDNIRSENVASKYYNTYLVALSSIIQGYKDNTRGRIIIFEIIKVQTNELNKKTRQLRPLADHKISSNVMQCTEIRGNIAVCQGTRLMFYKFDRLDGLTAIAFHDMHLATNSISSIKNYLIAGDILSGMSLFYYQCKPVKIHKISVSNKITDLKHVMITSFHSKHQCSEALFVAFDSNGIFLFTYSPKNVISKNGEILVQRSQMYLNDHVLGSDKDIIYSSNAVYKVRQTICNESEVKMLAIKGKHQYIVGALKPITVKELLKIEDVKMRCRKENLKIERFCDDVKWVLI